MTKCELIDMFKNKIFPKQAEDLLKINYEGLGELDKQEYLRDTTIIIKLAEKGLKSEQEIVKPYLEKIRTEMQKLRGCTCSCADGIIDNVEDIIDKYEAESEGV